MKQMSKPTSISDDKLNILIYYKSISLGGQQVALLNLCKCFCASGHEVTWVYEFGSDLIEEVSKYANIVQMKASMSFFSRLSSKMPFRVQIVFGLLFNILVFLRIANKVDPNLLISSDGVGSILCGLFARISKNLHFRLIGSDLAVVEPVLTKYYRSLKLDCLVDLYYGWADVYRQLTERGVAQRKLVSFSSHAVDLDTFYPINDADVADSRRSIGIPDNALVIGWIGRMAPGMQVKNTIELGKELCSKGFSNFRILLVGGGRLDPNTNSEDTTYVDYMRNLSHSYGLTSNCIFTGWVKHEHMNTLINMMDVVPLLESDPHGGSILREAMACGKVALSVNGRSQTQKQFMKPDSTILVESDSFISNAADEIIRLSSDVQRLRSLGIRARDYALHNFSFQRQVDEILSNYRCLVERRCEGAEYLY
jgi:glycosyltransferase involved in cell wall biosynthesis